MAEYVTLKELANKMGMDKSNARRYILKNGFAFRQIRTTKSRGQAENVLTQEDAESVVELRQRQFYDLSSSIDAVPAKAWFYIIQLVPDLNPMRIKLGYAIDVSQRLSAHRTSAPTAELLKAWPAKQSWEYAAIDSITRTNCQSISNEVYDCDNLETLVQRGDEFFALMPILNGQ